MAARIEVKCKTPGCEYMLQSYLPASSKALSERWCYMCDRVHQYQAEEFRPCDRCVTGSSGTRP